MQFCPKCGSMMRLQKVGKESVFLCECGGNSMPNVKNIVERAEPKPELKVLMSEINPLAVYDHRCPKCGFEKAQLSSKGIQYTDEDEELHFICGKCGYHDKADGLRAK